MPSEAADRPLVLVHGLLDTPRLFSRLERRLEGQDRPVLSPHLPHRFGAIPLRKLAHQLDGLIQERWGPKRRLTFLAFRWVGSLLGLGSKNWMVPSEPIDSLALVAPNRERSQHSAFPPGCSLVWQT